MHIFHPGIFLPTKQNNKSKADTKKPSSSNKKIIIVIIPIIIIIGIIGIYWGTQSSPTVSAQLIIDNGIVEVKQGNGPWNTAETGMLLYESDAVRTGEDTFASVILFESSIIRLDSNTEILIKQLIQEAEKTEVTIEQETGRTWNTVQKISGIDNYKVQTPTTIASVRGTTFDVNITGTNGTTDIGVVNGTVNVSKLENGTVIGSIDVKENKSVTVDPKSNKTLETKPLKQDEWIKKNLEEDKVLFEQVKQELYARIEPYIPELKQRYGMTDEELEILLDGYLSGYFELPPETPQWIRDIIEI